MRIFIILLAVAAAGAGCKQNPQLPAIISPYRIDIQQGNVVTQEMVSKLKVGLTRSQVRFVLGSPLIADMFHEERWDYVYLMQRQGKPDERRRLTVIFEGDKLVTLEGDVQLSDKVEQPAPPAPKPPVAAKPAAPVTKPTAAAKPAPPAPKPEVAKPAEKAPVAATPVVKPSSATPAGAEAGSPAASKPAQAAGDAASPPPADAAKPVAAKDDAAKGKATSDSAAAGAPGDAVKTDDKKDAPKRGIFGKMLEKIGL